jgi:hypothetical protein
MRWCCRNHSVASVTEKALAVTVGKWMVGKLRRRCVGGNFKGAGAGDFATHVNIKALHYLIALAECLNFSRAADRCAVTQPTLSIQVRKLEEYLGVTLFERNRARVVLTAEGEKVLRLARVIVGAADEILCLRRARLRDEGVHYAKPTRPQIGVGAAVIEEINYRAHTDG